jgi:hypothetical protein
MISVKTLTTVVAVVAGIHGWIWLQADQVHPCKAAETRLLREYGPTAFEVGLGTMFAGKQYQPKTEAARRLVRKLETLEPFGVFGCYPPAVLGWRAVPPF